MHLQTFQELTITKVFIKSLALILAETNNTLTWPVIIIQMDLFKFKAELNSFHQCNLILYILKKMDVSLQNIHFTNST